MINSLEKKILDSIKVASENDPNCPEFPPENPKFPATPTYKISVLGFKNVYLKDESFNPTGTHKDRMAWEMAVTYRYFLLAKKSGQFKGPLPQMSIISSGSAAIAIQSRLKKHGLPNLKVLVDLNLNPKIIEALGNLGCEVYITDLSKKSLSANEILTLTKNPNGIDITSSDALDPTTRYYDWLSYEIVNNKPDYCFIPFGTGNLYENILNVNKRELTTKHHDPRFRGNLKKMAKCLFFGAATDNPNSKADKLYSPHLPFAHFDDQWISVYRYAGYCGYESGVILFREKYLDEALKIAHEQNIKCEPSGIAGLALMLQMSEKLPKDKKILIVNTGCNKII